MTSERENSNEEVLQNDEFKHSALGVYISQRGITFCLHPAHQDVSVSFFQRKCGEFSKNEILAHMQEFQDFVTARVPSIQILATTFSFPGPIEHNSVTIPNFWVPNSDNTFSLDEFSHFSFMKGQCHFINDIQALGHGLISTDEFYGLEDDFGPLWKPPAMDVMPTLYPLYFSSEAAAVFQVHLGLGVAIIVPIDSADSYRVIASEWGHSLVQLCGPDEPGYEEERSLLRFIEEKQGHAVEWEEVCSTRGLANCYEFERKNTLAPGEGAEPLNAIAEIEKDPSDPIANKSLMTHFKFLMRFARMCAISFTCKSVFITYSVLNGGTEALQRHIAMCRDEFMHFTKSEWVSNVSVFVQNTDRNISEMGVMYHAYLLLARNESTPTIMVADIG
jgi:glucokinase